MTDNLFQSDKTPLQIDETKQYLSDLVGEGKKFKDAEALAKGKAQADMYVDNLKSELDTMRADYMRLREEHMAGAKLQELVDQMKKQQQSEGDYTPKADDVKQPELKLDDVKKAILDDLRKEKDEETGRKNLNTVVAKLKERHGNNFHGILQQQRETLNLTEDYMNNIARSSPEAFFKLMDLNEQRKQETFQAPPSSTQRESFAPGGPKRTWAWWQGVKKEDPKKYWAPAAIAQRHKDAVDLGDAFNDGDSDYWDRLGNPTLRH